MISVVGANRYSEVLRLSLQNNDLAGARKAIGTSEYFHPWFQRSTALFSGAEIAGMIARNGCVQIGEYGVRCVCDYLPNEPKYDEAYYRELEQLEYELTDLYPYKLTARFFQVISRKDD